MSTADQNLDAKVPDAQRDAKPRLLGIEPVETRHEISLRGRKLKYLARAGVLPLKNENDEIEAEIFFTAYEAERKGPSSERPLTFVFNGGPGASSIWLHIGAIGPWKVKLQKEGWMPKPPFAMETNPYTWLDQTDLVFIDPVGTGFSRAASPKLDQKFWNEQGDFESIVEFVLLYLTRYQRWNSPIFLGGESYGTTRAAAMAGQLIDKGVVLNGLIFISSHIDGYLSNFSEGFDLPYTLVLPAYASTAWYHKKLRKELLRLSLPQLNAEVLEWSLTTYTMALAKGDQLSAPEKRSVAMKLAEYTGLPLSYIMGANLKVQRTHFCKELLREERRCVGVLDSRFKGVEALAINEKAEFDPSHSHLVPPFVGAFNSYLQKQLRVKTDWTYFSGSTKVNQGWDWGKRFLVRPAEAVRKAMGRNPFMKLFVTQGYYDLRTPAAAAEYLISHMNLDASVRGNVHFSTYASGHMFYVDSEALVQFKKDTDKFYQSALVAGVGRKG